jgi:hypothetical protein
MSAQQPPSSADRASLAGSDARLRTVFGPGELVWITEEQFDPNGPLWRVTLVCQGEGASWWRRRYRYDIPSDTLHFTGQEPLSDADLLAARARGRRL